MVGFAILLKLKQSDDFFKHLEGNTTKDTGHVAKEIYFATSLFNTTKKEILTAIEVEKPELYIIVNPEGKEESYFPTEYYKAECIKDIIFRERSSDRFIKNISKLPAYYRDKMSVNEDSIYDNIVCIENVRDISPEEFKESLINKVKVSNNEIIDNDKLISYIDGHFTKAYLMDS